MIDSKHLYKFAEFTLNPAKRKLFYKDSEVVLGDKDFDVLLHLIENRPQIQSPDEIIETVWNGTNVENNAVEKAISSIRNVLKDDFRNPRFVKTVRGKGYLFIDDVNKVALNNLSENGSQVTKDIYKKSREKKFQKYVVRGSILALVFIVLFGLIYYLSSSFNYNVESEKVKKAVKDSQLVKFDFYKNPKSFSREKANRYFLPIERGGKAILKLENKTNKLIGKKWKYASDTNLERFDILSIKMQGNVAEVATEESWYSPVLYENNNPVPEKEKRTQWKAVYMVRKVEGEWLVEDYSTPY